LVARLGIVWIFSVAVPVVAVWFFGLFKMARSLHARASRFWSIDKFGVRRVVGINNEEFLLTTAQKTVNLDLAFVDTNDGTSPSIQNLIFVSTTVTKYDNDFILVVGPNEGLKPHDPICQSFHIRLVGHTSKSSWVISCHPCH
jgi:hypothetical protein